MMFLVVLTVSSLLLVQQVSASTCQDNVTQCTTESTCCELISGQYGCCPIPNAVCCSDRQHCCPEGFTCIGAVCTRGTPYHSSIAAGREVVCPDGQHLCPDQMTCCHSLSSSYACCPLPDAICCSDGEHCCPRGTTCDVAEGKCLPPATISVNLLTPAAARADDVPCSSTFSCPSGDTCCHVPSGDWGCCPLTGAVCCNDLIHCCPHGSRCGPSGCIGISQNYPIHLLRFSVLEATAKAVICPGGQYECPDQTTCCKLPSGEWGCCPLPQAVCCDDHVHCCPNGYTCSSGICSLANSTSIPWLQKQNANPVHQSPSPFEENLIADEYN